MHRRELREHIFKLLFQIEFNDVSEMAEHIELYLDDLPGSVDDERPNDLPGVSDDDKQYIRKKVGVLIEKIENIDHILNENTTGWKTTRMGKVDLTILRLALYEMLWDEDVPTGVAINEAVELAKKFSGEDSPSFVNGVLAKCVTSIQ